MKTSKFLFLASCLGSTFLFTACDDEVFGIKGEGAPAEELRTVEDFDALAVAIPGKIYFSQGQKKKSG